MKKSTLISWILLLVLETLYINIFDSIGPLIPYYAEATSTPESRFTVITTMRGLGYIIGGIVKVNFMKNVSLNKGLAFNGFGAGILTFLFSLTFNIYLMSILTFLFSMLLMMMEVFMNISVMSLGKNDVKFWMSLGITFQSFGTIIGPGLISLFGIRIFGFMGLFLAVWSLGFMFVPQF